MELLQLDVKGLFGILSHTIKFRSKEKITLLIGQNGLGKTIILKLIKAFYDEDFIELSTYYFHQLTFHFPENLQIVIVKHPGGEDNLLTITRLVDDEVTDQHTLARKVFGRLLPQFLDNNFDYGTRANYELELSHYLRKVLPDRYKYLESSIWVDLVTRKRLTTNELIRILARRLPDNVRSSLEIPEWLKIITVSKKVQIIESQRLLNKIKSEEGRYKSAVLQYSQEIIEIIRSKRGLATDLATKLDRSYPIRLVEMLREQNIDISPETVYDDLNQLEKKRKLLNTAGLIDAEEFVQDTNLAALGDMQLRKVLKLYIEDSREKLSIYDDLLQRIHLLLTIINSRFLFKKFEIDKEKGFKFVSTKTNEEIPIGGLSSGEQHELILFYQLLFNTTNDSFFLIDEPEISLHISWQNQFMDDIKEITKINGFDILIATHSPDIIGTYWELTNQLNPNQ